MARLSRAKSQAQTRARLLDAARAAFAGEGFGGASIDLIAAGAGYSKGAFYSNFASKEQLFLELMRQHMAGEHVEIEAIVGRATSLADVLRGLSSWFERMNSDLDWPLLAVELQLHARRNASFAKEYDALLAEFRRAFGREISRVFQLAGRRPPAPAEDLAGALMALATGLVLQGAASGPRPHGLRAGRLLKSVLEGWLALREQRPPARPAAKRS